MKLGDLGGGHFFAGRSEADDVGEHDGEHTFFGSRADPAFLDKPHDQRAGDVASEGPQPVEHGVERSRQAIDLAKIAAGQRRHLIEIKIADRGRAPGRATDRARNGAGHECRRRSMTPRAIREQGWSPNRTA